MATKILVCWSGGCDSTLLLYHAARAFGTPSSPVRAITLTSDQVTSVKHEARARNRLLKEFSKRGLHISRTEVSITTVHGAGLDHHGLPQAVIWLLASQALREHESLSLGYIRGDDWIQHVEAFSKVFDGLQKIAERKGSLWLPLRRTQKRGVLRQLRDLKLLDLCWWCEVPSVILPKTGCGSCPSCETHAAGLWSLEEHGPGEMWEGDAS